MAKAPAKTPAKTPARAAAKAAPASGAAEAKSRFNAALEEARAGAAALGAEARERATVYGDQAKTTGEAWAEEAKVKAGELAVEGKARAVGGLAGLSKIVGDNAETIDDKLGVQYGDYARSASKSLQKAADTLDRKTVEDLGEDAREFVRKSPATAIGIAAVAGFLIARLFRGK